MSYKNKINYDNVASLENFKTEKENIFYTNIIDNILKYNNDIIILTDKKFNILMSNSMNLQKNENILQKAGINHSNFLEKEFQKEIELFGEKKEYKINVSEIDLEYEPGYLFYLKENIINNKVRFDNLVTFLKDEIIAPLNSQTTGLKIALKEENKELKEEILKSNIYLTRMLKNYILEDSQKDIVIFKREFPVKLFVKILGNSLNSGIEVINNCSGNINCDEKALKEAVLGLIESIEAVSENNRHIKLEITERGEDVEIEIIANINRKTYLPKITKEKLSLAEKIINAHEGRMIKRENEHNIEIEIKIPM